MTCGVLELTAKPSTTSVIRSILWLLPTQSTLRDRPADPKAFYFITLVWPTSLLPNEDCSNWVQRSASYSSHQFASTPRYLNSCSRLVPARVSSLAPARNYFQGLA